MEKRAFERILTSIEVRFFCCNKICTGIVTNFSENNMYIIFFTSACLPLNSMVEILIPLREKVLTVPVKVSRLVKKDGHYDAMGVEILNVIPEYVEFVNGHRFK